MARMSLRGRIGAAPIRLRNHVPGARNQVPKAPALPCELGFDYQTPDAQEPLFD